jgi:hypothetical protein
VEKKTFAEEVNAAFREAAAGPMKGVLAVADEPLVSVDFRCTDVSTSIDSSLTMVMGDDMVKVRGRGPWALGRARRAAAARDGSSVQRRRTRARRAAPGAPGRARPRIPRPPPANPIP